MIYITELLCSTECDIFFSVKKSKEKSTQSEQTLGNLEAEREERMIIQVKLLLCPPSYVLDNVFF